MFQSVNHSALDPRLLAGAKEEASLKEDSEIAVPHDGDAEIRGGCAQNADKAEDHFKDLVTPKTADTKREVTSPAGARAPHGQNAAGERGAPLREVAIKRRRATAKSSQGSRKKQ